VRDWFWERVPSAPTAAHFVAVLGIGFEGGNLDHARRFAGRFRAAGDEGARLQEIVGAEEDVRFAAHWFRRSGPAHVRALDRDAPPPLTPIVMRGDPVQRDARARAGLSPEFIEALAAYEP
jgi:hypothetical protein